MPQLHTTSSVSGGGVLPRRFAFRGAAGMTLVELMVVFVILAIVMAVVIPLTQGARSYVLPFAAQMMQRDFEWAQVEAQRLSEDVLVIAYPNSELYGIWDTSPTFVILPHPFWSSGDGLTVNGLVDVHQCDECTGSAL